MVWVGTLLYVAVSVTRSFGVHLAYIMKSPKHERFLLSNRQYRSVYDRGQKFSNPFFGAFVLPTDTGLQRLGLTTTRKLGNAVVRNRCRRRLREVYRRADLEQFAGAGFDLVLNVRSSVAKAEFAELEKEFASLLSRVRKFLEKNGNKKNGQEATESQRAV